LPIFVEMKKISPNDYSISFRVRYSETDQMGVVYHGSYVPYFEIGRVEWLRNKGVSYKKLEEDGYALPIVSMKIDYKRPARYDDLITVKTHLSHFEGVKLYFDCEILNEKEELLTMAHFVLVFIQLSNGKPSLPPPHIQALLDALVDG